MMQSCACVSWQMALVTQFLTLPLPVLSTTELCAVSLLNGVPTSGGHVATPPPPWVRMLLAQVGCFSSSGLSANIVKRTGSS